MEQQETHILILHYPRMYNNSRDKKIVMSPFFRSWIRETCLKINIK
jgi:hypothetical protein